MKDLYYVLMYNKLGNAKQCKTLIKHGNIEINGHVVRNPYYQVHYKDHLTYQNQELQAQPFFYYMLNKPKGYLCANHDQKEKCAVELIDHKDCFCLGRLDRDTTGLLILTNDKNLKKLLLPQNHIPKTYLVETKSKLVKEYIIECQKGIIIDGNKRCLPAYLEIQDDHHALITITEGKYHQIKKMFLSLGNEVISLKRISFGKIQLDEHLKEGEARLFNQQEIELLCRSLHENVSTSFFKMEHRRSKVIERIMTN